MASEARHTDSTRPKPASGVRPRTPRLQAHRLAALGRELRLALRPHLDDGLAPDEADLLAEGQDLPQVIGVAGQLEVGLLEPLDPDDRGRQLLLLEQPGLDPDARAAIEGAAAGPPASARDRVLEL